MIRMYHETTAYLSRWRSPKAEAPVPGDGGRALGRVPTPPARPLDVETGRGTTRAYRWAGHGRTDRLPPRHRRHVAALGRRTPRHSTGATCGRSTSSATPAAACSASRTPSPTISANRSTRRSRRWASSGAHLVGHSLGGWLALNLAIRRPSRVASAVLLDPVGIGDLHMLGFMLWGVPVLLGALRPRPVRRSMARRFRMPLLDDKRAIRLALYGQINHPPRIPRLLPFTDDELRSITVPIAVLVGEKTEPFDADELVDRARH